jgi:hypothetical protein
VSVKFDIQIANKATEEIINFQEIHNMRALELETIVRHMPRNMIHLKTFNWLTFVDPTENNWNVVSLFKKTI